jgi:molybdopterin synthase catalytic subunit
MEAARTPIGAVVEGAVEAPGDGDDWLALSSVALPVAAAADWTIRPDCGALALFCGTARDHAGDRLGVEELVYEAYVEQALPRLAAVAGEMRARWPVLGRIALLHRTGSLALGDVAVVVAVSAPHRRESFEAARFGIDAIKASVPIWKKERWDGGSDWGVDGAALRPAAEVPG